ncbi:hypothetical protein ABH943_006119 [Caballeronia udeis]|uniref:Uncharacterized protein n=1 Tax=Caballeronia udeis TaxID=1232866 RepID=A0ABW8MRN1_9BURK
MNLLPTVAQFFTHLQKNEIHLFLRHLVSSTPERRRQQSSGDGAIFRKLCPQPVAADIRVLLSNADLAQAIIVGRIQPVDATPLFQYGFGEWSLDETTNETAVNTTVVDFLLY